MIFMSFTNKSFNRVGSMHSYWVVPAIPILPFLKSPTIRASSFATILCIEQIVSLFKDNFSLLLNFIT